MRQRMIGILVVAMILLLGIRGDVRSDTLTITEQQSTVRAGLDSKQAILTTASQGMTFALLETRQGRYKILPDGEREGWIVKTAGRVEQSTRPLQVAPATGQDVPRPSLYHQSWAVVVGVNRFRHPDIHALNYAVNDARAVAQALSSLGFPASNITLLLDAQATKQEVERLL